MASFEDIKSAARIIANNAEFIEHRSQACGENLRTHAQRLARVGKGNQTAMDAVRRVTEAQQAVLQSAAALLTMRNRADRFIAELSR